MASLRSLRTLPRIRAASSRRKYAAADPGLGDRVDRRRDALISNAVAGPPKHLPMAVGPALIVNVAWCASGAPVAQDPPTDDPFTAPIGELNNCSDGSYRHPRLCSHPRLSDAVQESSSMPSGDLCHPLPALHCHLLWSCSSSVIFTVPSEVSFHRTVSAQSLSAPTSRRCIHLAQPTKASSKVQDNGEQVYITSSNSMSK